MSAAGEFPLCSR